MEIVKYDLKLVVRENADGYTVFTDDSISDSDKLRDNFNAIFNLSEQTEEVFCMFAFNTKSRIIGAFEVSRGTLSSTLVHPREVFKRLLLTNASTFAVAHNHPSGIPEPSTEDIRLSDRLLECAKLMGIQLLDNLIICEDSYYSFRGHGQLL